MQFKLLPLSAVLITMTALNPVLANEIGSEPSDSIRTFFLDDVQVFSSTKENTLVSEMPLSISSISGRNLQTSKITSIKSIGTTVPNFYMPEYGSRLTSSIYIRGIGSRINSPAVGLYVDDIPYYEKSAFDFRFFDVERIDVLRGPQGTLYGRNTMGGLIRISTRNPFINPGTDITLGYASGNEMKNLSANHYAILSDNFAYSIGGYYEDGGGFFTNSFTGRESESLTAFGGRARAIWLPNENLKIDMNVSYDDNDEQAYPYFYDGSISAPEKFPTLVGKISNNRGNSYVRNMLNAGVSVEYQTDRLIMTAVTGFQGLDDDMNLDQDFLSADIYTLEQQQRSLTLSEELTVKNRSNGIWQWTSGINLFAQRLDSRAPVFFHPQGVVLLETLINSNIPVLPPFIGITDIAVDITDPEITMDGKFETPIKGISFFHQSTVELSDRLYATLGLRADFETAKIEYDSYGMVNCQVSMLHHGVLESQNAVVAPRLNGDHDKNFFRLMPKVAFKYSIPNGNLYATISRGTRSGGYNIQTFSDQLQSKLQSSMKAVFMPGGGGTSTTKNEDPGIAASFKPESSWNYEIGTHLAMLDDAVSLDASLFMINTHDQQISKFISSGMGRQMVNAGNSRSMGAELSLHTTPFRNLHLSANYGYTHAKFLDYEEGGTDDFSGNRVPFVPENTVRVGGEYVLGLSKGLIENISLGADYNGVGRIYWTESNSAYQNYYSTLDAHLLVGLSFCQINLWAKNITDSQYNVFYFESMGRGFHQQCRPAQVGVDLKFSF